MDENKGMKRTVLEECQNEKKRENRENKGVGSESFLF
jgi:hypothetical protein